MTGAVHTYREKIRDYTILAGSVLMIMAPSTLSPVLPSIARAVAGTPGAEYLVQMVLTLPALFTVLAAPLMGWLLDKTGRKPVMTVSILAYGLAGSCGLFIDDLIWILVGRAVLGVAVAGTTAGCATLICDYHQGQDLDRFMGRQGAVMNFASVACMLGGGVLAGIQWQLPFAIYMYAFLVLPFFIWSYRPGEDPGTCQAAGPDAEPAPLPLARLSWILALFFSGMGLFFVVPVFLPFHLEALLQGTPSEAGLSLALMGAASGLISMFYGRLRSFLRNSSISGLIFMLMALAHIIFWTAASWWLVLTGLVLTGLAQGLLLVTFNAWIASITSPVNRGRAMSGMTTALFLGQFVSPPLFQPTLEALGLAGAFGAAGGLCLVLALGSATLGRKLD